MTTCNASLMRFVRYSVTLALLVALLGQTGHLRAAVLDGVAAHYALDGAGQTVTDSQNSLDGFLGSTGAADSNDPTRVVGYVGTGALDFTPGAVGVVDIVNLTASTNYLSSNTEEAPRSFTTWINIDDFGTAIRNQGRLMVMHRGSPSTGYSAAVGSSADAGATGRLNLVYNTGSNGAPTNTFTEVNTGGAFFGSGWHHAAYAYDGTDTRIYFDGELYATETHTASTLTTANAVLGAFATSGGTADGIDGQLDDVGFWTRTLSEAEVAVIAAFGDAGFVGTGNNLNLASVELDSLLALSALGGFATVATKKWQFTDTFPTALDASPLALGKHYIGSDGNLYVILGGTPGNFTGIAGLPIPEPATSALLALGVCGLCVVRRRRRRLIRSDRTMRCDA